MHTITPAPFTRSRRHPTVPGVCTLLLVVATLLSACSGSSNDFSTSRNNPTTPPTPPTYTLSVSTSGSGTVASAPSGINCGATCSASYASGTSVTLTATPASGYSFTGWGGACSGSGTCTVSMTGVQSVTAIFSQDGTSSYSLSVSKTGSGTVTSSPGGINCGTICSASYASGIPVTLTAAAASGYRFSGWSGACSGTGACILSMTVARSVSATFIQTGAAAGTPVIFYSDLDSGPNTGGENNKGVFVTIAGKNFGATRGTSFVTVGGGQVDNYPLWSDTKIIFQLGASPTTGNIAVTTGAGTSDSAIPFTVRAGAIYFVAPNGTGNGLSVATPMSPSAAYAVMGPGKTFYFRGGIYNQNYSGGGIYGYTNYSIDQAHGGTPGLPLALVGYPGETATWTISDATRFNFLFNNNNAPANYVTLANHTIVGGSSCINDGGFYANGNSGGVHNRVINNVLSAVYGTANTMTGLIVIQNNYWKVLGNEFKDTGSGTPINNNHGIYNQAGSSFTEIAWNYFHDLRMGGVVQVHTDVYYTYTDVRIHDNVFAKGTNGDSRGIVVGGALTGTYGSIYNNIFDGIGSNYGAIGINSGDWKVYNNTFYNIYAPGGMVWVSNLPRQLGGAPANWGMPTADIKNNILYSDGQSPYVTASSGATMAQMTLSNNLYSNFGAAPVQDASAISANPLFVNAAAGNLHLQTSSPAIDTGTASVNTVVGMDHDGTARPQGGGFDIGTYEQ